MEHLTINVNNSTVNDNSQLSSCPENCLRYQSPIDLSLPTGLSVSQQFCRKGKNNGAVFDPHEKIFVITDRIILKVRSGKTIKKYRMVEYHFHIPGEHQIESCDNHSNGKIYPAEIHYVFTDNLNYQITDGIPHCNICNEDNHLNINNNLTNENLFVIGYAISNDNGKKQNFDIFRLNVKPPKYYYLYDGALTGGDVSIPVRWVVGRFPLTFPISEIVPYAKSARALQPLDGRLILLGLRQ
jgi:carbonic anhydrase